MRVSPGEHGSVTSLRPFPQSADLYADHTRYLTVTFATAFPPFRLS